MSVAGFSLLLSFVVFVSCDDFGLINLLYWKADANLDQIIDKSELQDIWYRFDNNNDKNVTQSEFLPLWRAVTGHSPEKAHAYFLLADLNDNDVIDQSDVDALYKIFDHDGNGLVSAKEFSDHWQRVNNKMASQCLRVKDSTIIVEIPFVVMFDYADSDGDGYLIPLEFDIAFHYLDIHPHTADIYHNLLEKNFVSQWIQHGFGSSQQAHVLYQHLDIRKENRIDRLGLAMLFTKYDLNADHSMSRKSFMRISELVPSLTDTQSSLTTSQVPPAVTEAQNDEVVQLSRYVHSEDYAKLVVNGA